MSKRIRIAGNLRQGLKLKSQNWLLSSGTEQVEGPSVSKKASGTWRSSSEQIWMVDGPPRECESGGVGRKRQHFQLKKTIEISYSGIFHEVFEPQKLLQRKYFAKTPNRCSWFASFSSSERPCLAYRSHHFIGQRWWDRGNFMWFKLIEMLQIHFYQFLTSTGSLTTHFKSKEPKSGTGFTVLSFVNVKNKLAALGSDGGFAVITRTRWKDKHRLHCGTWAGVL